MAKFRTGVIEGQCNLYIFFISKGFGFSVSVLSRFSLTVGVSRFCLAMSCMSPWLTFYQLCLQHLLVWNTTVSGTKGDAELTPSEILKRVFDDLSHERKMLSFISTHFCVCKTC